MTELSLKKLAETVANRAKKLALEAEAVAVLADDPGSVRAGIEMIDDSEKAVCFWIEQLKKAATK